MRFTRLPHPGVVLLALALLLTAAGTAHAHGTRASTASFEVLAPAHVSAAAHESCWSCRAGGTAPLASGARMAFPLGGAAAPGAGCADDLEPSAGPAGTPPARAPPLRG